MSIEEMNNGVRFRRPLLDLWTATAVLNCTEDKVLELLDDGQIQWAWNIASKGSRKRCVRILAQSLTNYSAAGAPKKVLSEGEAFAIILPGHSENVLASRVAAAFNCSNQHVSNLLLEAKLIPKTRKGRRTDSPYVPRRAVLEFLRARTY